MNAITVAAVVSGACFWLLRQLTKPIVQNHLPAKLQWQAWPLEVQLGVVFALNLGGIMLGTYSSGGALGAALPDALKAAAVAAVGAVGLHKTTLDAGHEQTRRALINDPAYEPGSIRTVLDATGLLPIDRKALEARDNAG